MISTLSWILATAFLSYQGEMYCNRHTPTYSAIKDIPVVAFNGLSYSCAQRHKARKLYCLRYCGYAAKMPQNYSFKLCFSLETQNKFAYPEVEIWNVTVTWWNCLCRTSQNFAVLGYVTGMVYMMSNLGLSSNLQWWQNARQLQVPVSVWRHSLHVWGFFDRINGRERLILLWRYIHW